LSTGAAVHGEQIKVMLTGGGHQTQLGKPQVVRPGSC
jgi:hypothetical protein